MPKMRRKYGPDIIGIFPRPEVPGELVDVDVTTGVKTVRAAGNGLIDIDVVFTIPAFDPTTAKPLAELHAVVFPPGHGIPNDPDLAVASNQPMASTTSTGSAEGGDVLVTVPGAPAGVKLTIKTVLGYLDDDAEPSPTPASPADPAPEPTATS